MPRARSVDDKASQTCFFRVVPPPHPATDPATMPDHEPLERRRHPRAPIVRTCKLRPVGALRYDGGTTEDASWGGLAVHVRTGRRFAEGDRVEIVVAWEGESVATAPAAEARVRRVTAIGAHEQQLALELERQAQQATGVAAA
ncbi:MAG: hypothetical protein Tsb0013_18690 [Phycisphaerales bacterium]